MLNILAHDTGVAMLKLRGYPPVKAVDYGEWMLTAYPDLRIPAMRTIVAFDERSGQFVDPWGEPLVLVVEEGRLVALASKGQDRKWDSGKEDDIILHLSEVGILTEPPGTPWPRPTENAGNG